MHEQQSSNIHRYSWNVQNVNKVWLSIAESTRCPSSHPPAYLLRAYLHIYKQGRDKLWSLVECLHVNTNMHVACMSYRYRLKYIYFFFLKSLANMCHPHINPTFILFLNMLSGWVACTHPHTHSHQKHIFLRSLVGFMVGKTIIQPALLGHS